MRKASRAGFGFVVGIGLLLPCLAQADLPPPPGKTQVHYAVRVTGAPQGVVLVAHPTYVSSGGSVEQLTADKDLVPIKGYTPGIYSLSAEDAASLAGKSGDVVKAVLAAKGHVCVQEVPRVFTVPTETKITSIIDVVKVEATPASCRASLEKTLYGGANGEKGEGGVDASGHRLPPPPFSGEDLPVVTGFDIGGAKPVSSSPQTPSSPPAEAPRTGCSGCSTPAGTSAGGFALALIALAGVAIRRGRRRSSSQQ